LDLNFGRPIKFESSTEALVKRLSGNFGFIIGRSASTFFNQRMSNRWWQEVGKKGKPRGLCQGIELDIFTEQLKVFNKMKKTDLYQASLNLYYELSKAQIKKSNISFFADSTPSNMQNGNRIIKLLPNAYFINMIRDGRDVALSVSKERWGPDDPALALKWWQKRIVLANQGLTKIAPERKLDLRLEDLIVYNRDQSYNSVLNLLGLADNPELAAEFDKTFSKEKMSMGTWKNEVKSPAQFEKSYLKILKQLSDQGIEIKQYY
jgi:hypothetical protein